MKNKVCTMLFSCLSIVLLLISVSSVIGYTPATFRALFNLTYTVPTQIDVILDANGGVFSDESNTKQTYLKYGGLSALEKPTKDGYDFHGWMDENNVLLTGDEKFPFTDGVTLKACWKQSDAVYQTLASTYDHVVTLDPNGADDSTITYKGVNYGTTYTDLPIPTRAGYTFGGWYAEFNGSSSAFIPYGRAYMFTDKLSIHLTAYMTNWAGFYHTMSLISCTERGGWNLQNNEKIIEYINYNNGDYKRATSTILWSNLSSGWHDFDAIFDGTNAKLYLDDSLIATSPDFTSSGIEYHATNGIFVGVEADGNQTTPAGNCFTGYIGNISIQNNTTRLGSTGALTTYTCANANVTLKAKWTENS